LPSPYLDEADHKTLTDAIVAWSATDCRSAS
jgi:hypothetical protein